MASTSRKTALAAIITAALVAGFTQPVIADSRDDLERERRGVSGKIDGAQKSYDQSSKAFANAKAALDKAQARLDAAETTLRKTRGQLAVAEAEDARMQRELEDAEQKLEKAIARLKRGEARLRGSEKKVEQFTVESLQEGDRGMRTFGELLSGADPSDFTERMSMNNSISDAQVSTMQKLAASRVMLQLNRDEVEELRDEVAVAREAAAANLAEKQELEAAAEAQAAEVGELVEAREAKSSETEKIRREDAKTLQAYESERDSLNSRLAALAAKELREQRRRNNSGGGGGGGGGGSSSGGGGGGGGGGNSSGGEGFIRPVAGPITSQYGMRVHPITGVYKLHDGTDFSAPCGTPIRAAASGRVLERYYNSAYGNRLIINHGVRGGRSVATTYNHMIRPALKRPGARVSRGEIIGYSGTTGMSTGCHLHWMAIANGQTTNPMGLL
ncbi:peptidoglycan DD-metalloendopeptidase family protein [Aeromicrobium sp. CTD01-1L150]|uniref:peptidoglycan DD-metalloendopeptidase family protein n=1 Tax=Aeromicrobium sp. CTD01-1L150 TaxID=3341830 RepID=UPI0035C02A19